MGNNPDRGYLITKRQFLSIFHCFLTLVDVLVFGCTYFLRLERLYRNLFNWLRENRLRSKEFLFDMNSQSLEKRFGKNVDCLLQTMFSKTLAVFYLLLFAIIIASIIVDLWI